MKSESQSMFGAGHGRPGSHGRADMARPCPAPWCGLACRGAADGAGGDAGAATAEKAIANWRDLGHLFGIQRLSIWPPVFTPCKMG